jgi:putative transcriptional regulator
MNNRLPDLREAAGESQADLAEAVEVTRQTINAVERERYDPSLDLALALAEHYDTTVEDIFQRDAE